MPWSYFYAAGRDPIVLIAGIVIIILLIVIAIGNINLNCKDNKIKTAFYLALFIQLIILIIDNYIVDFPLINIDARAHEAMGWFSYENNVNIGRGNYNYLIINPIYKLLKIRTAAIFGAINIIAHILISLNIYKIFNILKIERKLKRFLMMIVILSPISLVMRAGLLREAIIILFASYSLKAFIEYVFYKNPFSIVKMFLYLTISSLFHSGTIFLTMGYFIYLLGGGKNQKILQWGILLVAVIGFILFKDQFLEKVGAGDVDKILAYNNSAELKSAGSVYLESITTNSLGQIVVFLPLFMFYFLYSPTPEMIRGILDIITLLLNSSIYIYITIIGIKTYKKVRKSLSKREKQIVKALLFSALLTIAVFSVGTRNAGTAMRHRDKVLPFLIVIFAIIRNKYFIELRYRKIQKRDIGRDLNETN